MNEEITLPIKDYTSEFISLRSRFQSGLTPIILAKTTSWNELYEEALAAVRQTSAAIDDVAIALSNTYGADYENSIETIKNKSSYASSFLSKARAAVSRLDRNQAYSGTDLQEGLLQRNAVKSLRHQLAALAYSFHSSQNEFMKAAKRQNKSFENEELDENLTPSQINQLQSIIISNSETASHRLQEINQIAESVTQLADLTRELAHLVESNGTIVDSINNNISEALQETEKGVQELVKADKNSRRAERSMKIIYFLMIIVFILMIVMMAKIGKKFSK